ncbi:MAG: hypothetical protein KDB88_01815, partial [Flavobacteriales bacterium]|nr:hypothetical protein [Flavobacteriales bacterium]
EAAACSDQIDLAAWIAHDTDGDGGSDALSLPKGIGMDLRVDVKELAFEDFRGRNIAGHVMMRNGILRAEPVSFNTASGQVKGSLVLDGSVSSPFALRIDADLSEISVRELFTEFRNFGQDFIRSEQLAGVARSQVRFEAPLSPTLSLDLDRLRCTIDLRIDKGNLKGHAPLMAVADHVQGNKLIAPFVDTRALRDRLADVQFASLENRIEIRDRQVIIPLMEVKSSVMDIELSGQHGFDDVIDHHVNFRLGELLRNGPLEDEFGPIVDDGTGVRVFLHMFGPADDPSFETDNAMASARRQQQWRNEKQVLGDLFKEEFGGDRDKQAILKDPRNTRFQVEWGDSSLTNAQQPPTPKRKDRDEDPKVTFEIED